MSSIWDEYQKKYNQKKTAGTGTTALAVVGQPVGTGVGSVSAGTAGRSGSSIWDEYQRKTAGTGTTVPAAVGQPVGTGVGNVSAGTAGRGGSSIWNEYQRKTAGAAAVGQPALYSEAAERVTEQQLKEAKAQMDAAKETMDAAKREWTKRQGDYAAFTGVADLDIPEQNAYEEARAAYQQAQADYGRLAGLYTDAAYGDLMGGVRTDLSRVGEYMNNTYATNTHDEKFWTSRNALQETRKQLQAEGLSDEEIDGVFDYLQRQYNAEQTQAAREKAQEKASESGGIRNGLVQIGSSLGGGLMGAPDLAVQWVINKLSGPDPVTGLDRTTDYNSAGQRLHHISQATGEGETEKIVENYAQRDEDGNMVTDEYGNVKLTTEGNIRMGAYNLSVSMGQSAVVAGLSMMGAPGATLLLSFPSAVSTAQEYHERGFSDGTALFMGAVDGALEYFTEKMGLDQLFKVRSVTGMTGVKNKFMGWLRNAAMQGLSEGSEELLSTVGHTIADAVITGDRNELNRRYAELEAMGYSREEAQKIACKEWVWDALADFGMGALSGVLFGTAGTVARSGTSYVDAMRRGGRISESTAAEIQARISELDASVRQAANVSETFDPKNQKARGRASQGLDRAETMESIRGMLQDAGEENISSDMLTGLYAQAVDQRQTLAEQVALLDLDPRVRKHIAENARTELEEIRKDPLKRLYTQVLEEQSDPGEAALDAQNSETAPQETRDTEDGTHDDIHTDMTQARYYEDAAKNQEISDNVAEAEAAYRRKAKELMRQEKEYDGFSEVNNTRKLYDRLQVARYGPKQDRAAKKAARAEAEEKTETVVENIGRSLGAKAKNYDVYNPESGSFVNLAEGTSITQPKNHIMAGAGRNRQIDCIDWLIDKYGGDALKWTKEKGFGYVLDEYGEVRKVELHWYQEPSVGKVRMKIKFHNGRIYLDED